MKPALQRAPRARGCLPRECNGFHSSDKSISAFSATCMSIWSWTVVHMVRASVKGKGGLRGGSLSVGRHTVCAVCYPVGTSVLINDWKRSRLWRF